jgi:hypothetical protein
MKAKKERQREEMLSRAKLSKGLTKSNSHRHRSALVRLVQLPGDSGDVLAHPVIAELQWPVKAGVEDNNDVATRGLKDLILLELWGEVNKLQIGEFAEGPGNEVVEEAQDEASVLGGVDDLGLEDHAPAVSGESSRCEDRWVTSSTLVIILEGFSWNDSGREVVQVSGSFGGGA